MNPALEEEIKTAVRRLFTAENERNDKVAEEFLAPDSIPIIRGNGHADRDRSETLTKIGNPGRPHLVRHVDQATIDVTLFCNDTVAIARTLLPTTDTTATPPDATFHNMQVFLRRNDQWQVVAWQVTKIG